MPYNDDERRHFEIDGAPSDYYPPRRSRMVIGAILAGWVFMMITSSHPLFFDHLYRGTLARIIALLPHPPRLGDWPTTDTLYAASGIAAA